MICSLQVNRLFHCRLSACLYNRCTAALVSTPDSFLRFAHITHLCPQYHPPLPTISPTFAHNITHLCPQYHPPLPTISTTFANNINHLCPQYQPPLSSISTFRVVLQDGWASTKGTNFGRSLRYSRHSTICDDGPYQDSLSKNGAYTSSR
jgi:hypothetical protein